ncbi:MAG: hypothetical protein K0S61_4053 [Anaerocolumna sp.]|jgi:uncharacterized membrane protein|nr:hypothetical protein [Anaerocolumna sp.]
MSNKKNNNKKAISPLLPVSIIIVLIAVILVGTDLTSRLKKDTNSTVVSESSNAANSDAISTNEEGDVVLKTDNISDKASFYEYDYNGTTVGLFAVKASDGTIRTALNTCQVCNGSPYAFFDQKENQFQCQNCGNLFSLDMIGEERGGCNPIPITSDERTESDNGSIVIPASFLEDNAALFSNWKKY